MDRRIEWHYSDNDEPVARTSWADEDYPTDRLYAAAYEGIGRWAEGEPLEDALGLVRDPGAYATTVLEVEYLAGAGRAGGNARAVTFRLEEREDDDDE